MKKISSTAIKTDSHLQLVDKALKESDRPKIRQLAKQVEKDFQFIERRILAGLATDTTFCQWAYEYFDNKYYQSPTAKKLAGWMYELFEEMGEAPHRAVEDKFREEMKLLPKDDVEDIEDILAGISEEVEQHPLPTHYLKRQATVYLKRRKIDHQISVLEGCELDEQMDLLGIDSVEQGDGLIVREIDDYANLDRPKMLMSPWLREGEYTLVYADKGVGKTMFAVLISYILACENYTERGCEINADDNTVWQVKRPAKTLYVAGEMAQGIMDRFKGFSWMGDYLEEYKPRIIDRGEQQARTNQPFSLSTRKNQRAIVQHLKQNPDIKLVVLDNVQTLFDLEDSNRESEWSNKVNPLLQDLEDAGVACLLLDHTGKDANRGAMGTHAKITRASYAIHLKDHPDKKSKNEGQAWFKVCPDYARYPEGTFNPFYLRFWKTDGVTGWEVTDGQKGSQGGEIDGTKHSILRGIVEGQALKQIAEELNTSPQNINYHKKWLQKEGYLNGRGTLTEYGESVLDKMEEDI